MFACQDRSFPAVDAPFTPRYSEGLAASDRSAAGAHFWACAKVARAILHPSDRTITNAGRSIYWHTAPLWGAWPVPET